MMAGHPATEVVTAAMVDGGDTDTDTMVEDINVGTGKETSQTRAEIGLGEEYGVMRSESAAGMAGDDKLSKHD